MAFVLGWVGGLLRRRHADSSGVCAADTRCWLLIVSAPSKTFAVSRYCAYLVSRCAVLCWLRVLCVQAMASMSFSCMSLGPTVR